MDFRRLSLVASAGFLLAVPAHAAGASCIGPANAQFCSDAFGNQTMITRDADSTRLQFSAVNKPAAEENTAAMMTDSGWQIEDLPTGTTVDPSLTYQLDQVSAPLNARPTR